MADVPKAEVVKVDNLYRVYQKGYDHAIFLSESALQCEFVAIALALHSLYTQKQSFEVRKGKTITFTYSTEIAFAAMQTKMRKLLVNRRVKRTMPLVPDRFTNMAHEKIIKMVKNGENLQPIYDRCKEEVDAYAAYVKSQI